MAYFLTEPGPLVERLLADVPGAPPLELVREEMMEAVREFCRQSWVWNETSDPLPVHPKLARYEIEAPSGGVAAKILSLSYMGRELDAVKPDWVEQQFGSFTGIAPGEPRWYTQEDSEELVLIPPPATRERAAMTMRVAFMPRRDAERIPALLLEHHRDALLDGARARMFAQPRKPWTDFEAADLFQQRFEAAIWKAKQASQAGLVRVVKRTVPRYL